MAPPHRTAPPTEEVAPARPRVQRLLRGRWEHRVTAVVAGAGMGKTVALARAVAEDGLEAVGTDVWLTCTPDDADATHLRDGLFAAMARLGIAHDASIIEVVASLAPRPVCLVLDDVHHVPPGSAGAEALADLVARLPTNGHVVLASRRSPPVPLARLAAQGQVLRVRGEDLRLRPDEVDGAADPPSGGWPALVALAASGDRRAVQRFVDEEVLADLTPAQHRLLAVASLLDGDRVELLQDLADAGRDDVDVVAELPLLTWEVDGRLVPDPLWRDLTAGWLDAASRAAAQEAAGAAALADGDLDRALRLAQAADAVDLVRAVLVQLTAPDGPAGPAALEAAVGTLGADLRRTPEGQLLQGLVLAARDPGAASSHDAYQRAADLYRAEGDAEGEARALAQLGYLAHVHRDQAALGAVLGRLHELQQAGSQLAAATTMLGGALLALSAGDADGALRIARSLAEDDLPAPWDVVAHWVAASACLNLGLDARDAAARLARRQRQPLPGMRDRGWLADLRAGEIAPLLTSTCPGLDDGPTDRDRHLGALVTAGVRALTGRTAEARRLLAAADRLATSDAVPAAVVNRAVVAAAIADASHEDDRAARILTEACEEVPLDGPQQASWLAAMQLFYRHVPASVPVWEAAELGGSWAVDRDLARVAAALHAGEPAAVVADLTPWPEPGVVVRGAGLRGAALLAAAGLAEERAEAHTLAAWLVDCLGAPARTELRALAEDERFEAGLRRLLSTVPSRPRRPRGLTLLGQPELCIGDAPVTVADWRRQRVQQLLAHLVLRGRTSRDALVDALWPEASEAAGRRSLRSTMNYLVGVLEPDRVAGEASWFVRADGDHVEVVADDLLTVDVADLEAAATAAAQAERDGVFSVARDQHDAVVDLWRGVLLEGHPEEGWLADERRRLLRLVVGAALRSGELHRAAGARTAALERGDLALDLDPYCEPAHRLVVGVHLDRGDRRAAREAAARCRDALLDLGVRPAPPTADLVRLAVGEDAG